MSCEAGLENLCLDNIDGYWWGVLIEVVVLAYAFVGVAIVADAHLVVSLETLCVRWSIREDVAGASFMAFGSAAPEIIINAVSTIKGVLSPPGDGGGAGDDSALGIGAIIGSGMIAFTAIPGCCALFAKQTLELKRRPLARDAGAYAVALAFMCFSLSSGEIGLGTAGTMLMMYVVYMLTVILSSSIRQSYRVHVLGRARRIQSSFVTSTMSTAEYETGSRTGVASVQPLSAQNVRFGDSGDGIVPVTVLATPSPADGAASLWDALPVQPSPMEFSSTDMALSLAPNASRGGTRKLRGIHAVAMKVAGGLVEPLNLALRITCPPCEHDSAHARWYPLTLAASFVWVSLFSTIIAAVVTRFGDLLGIPTSLLGMYVIAVGAEIPDTIQSVTVAKRGYGSMAVSNSTGSQIINILIGLGLPWFISNLAGRKVRISGVHEIQVMAYFQAANVFIFVSLLLLATCRTWKAGDHSKATLGRRKGTALLCMYVVALLGYAIHVAAKGMPTSS
uniref:Sodium/calcium exchanger membrane region domain-containing protein n=1 Tax=Calcidiscus leptoporus TaxID=127549 RepID=A0A7S0JLW0_9EUKA